MGPKADALRAMRERNFDAGAERRKIDKERERLKKAMDDAAARIAAKPKRNPLCPRPANSRPSGKLSAAECIASGECGCDLKPKRKPKGKK